MLRVTKPEVKTYGPGGTRTHDRAIHGGVCSTTQLPVHVGQAGPVATS